MNCLSLFTATKEICMKIKAALLSLILVLSLLLGCASGDATATPTEAPTLPTDAPTAVPTEEVTPEPTEEPTPEPTEEPTPEPTAEPVVYALEDYYGLYSSGVYMNLPFDLAFVIPESWGTEYEATMEENSFYAGSSDGAIAMATELVDAGQAIDDAFMNSFLELVKANWVEELEAMNAEISTMEITTMELAGRTVPALYFEAEQEGEYVYFVNGYLYTDSYLLSITVLTLKEDPFTTVAQIVNLPEEAKAMLTAAMDTATDSGSNDLEGYYVGTQYINPYFGLTVNLPEGWSFYDDATLAEQNGLDVSAMVGEDWEEIMRNSTSIILMGAQTADGMQNMNLTLTPVENASIVYTETQQQLTLESTVVPLTNVYTSMGYTIDSMDMETVEVMGMTLPCLHVQMSINGMAVSEVLFILVGEDYIFNVTFLSIDGSAYDLVPMLNPLS